MTDEKLATHMHDARLIAACDTIIYPLLETRIGMRLNIACARFREGKTDFVADIAYITGLQDLVTELKQLQTKGNRAYEKLHQNENEKN